MKRINNFMKRGKAHHFYTEIQLTISFFNKINQYRHNPFSIKVETIPNNHYTRNHFEMSEGFIYS